MCQVDDGSNPMLEEKPVYFGSRRRDCMKCGETAVVVARIKDAFCRSCFLTYFTHRFRATFGKAKVVRDGEKVLLAFSGGQCSSAMVNLVKRGLDQSTHKKLRFTPGLIYIDEGVVTGQSKEDRITTCQRITAMMKDAGFPWCIAALEESLDIPPQGRSTPPKEEGGLIGGHGNREPSPDELAEKLNHICLETGRTQACGDLLASVRSLTAKQDLVSNMRNRLLIHKALQMGYHKIAVGDCGTRLSSGILSNLAKGKGAAIPVAMAFADDRCANMAFVRPMREFTTKEIVMHNTLFDVDSVFLPTLATKAGEYASIDTLTESFINGLQTNFPSTVSTVFRTGEKMCVAERADTDEQTQRCSMCMSMLDTAVGKSSALSATRFSLRVSREGPEGGSCAAIGEDRETCEEASANQCCGQGDGSCHSSQTNRVSAESLNNILCYGCQVIVRDVDVNLLPSHIIDDAAKIQRRSRMRDEIREFLLTDES